MHPVHVARLFWDIGITLSEDQGHLLRGCLAGFLPEEDIAHNHDREGHVYYRYPMIQYKIVYGMPMVLGIGKEAIEIVQKIFDTVERLRIGKATWEIQEKSIQVSCEDLGMIPQSRRYQFLTPWLALNSMNYRKYRTGDRWEKEKILKSCLTGNLLSLSKYLDYKVPERISVEHTLASEPVIFKGESMIAFRGYFTANFQIPDFFGIGRSISRGYGCCIGIDF